MTHKSRREFLKEVTRSSLYAAPVVVTLVTPRSVSARRAASGMGDMSMSMDMGGMGQQRQLPHAPWFKPPPSSTPPGVKDPGD